MASHVRMSVSVCTCCQPSVSRASHAHLPALPGRMVVEGVVPNHHTSNDGTSNLQGTTPVLKSLEKLFAQTNCKHAATLGMHTNRVNIVLQQPARVPHSPAW